MPLDDRLIAISSTFTAEAIEPGLTFWAAQLELNARIQFAGYNQLFQELLDPAGLFARNRGGFNVALVRFDDLSADGPRELAAAIRSASAHISTPLIVAVCPGNDADCAAQTLRSAIANLPAIHVIAPQDVLSLYPVDEIHDPHANELGHVPYTPLFFVALATAIARRIHAIATPPYKVIALDCDDTLWAGICGEDGPQNVVLDEPRRALQEFMAERRRSGMLLALCSKNNEDDVVETFREHPGMPLRLEDFVSRRINWDPKAVNLSSLAAELELGLDSFILVDDNPKECEEAASSTPEVLALPLPGRPEEIPGFLQHVWAFDQTRITDEDRQRPELYAQRAARIKAEQSAPSLEAFLATLQLEVEIAPLRPEQVARVAQLTQRTNQMNVSGKRRTEAEIQSLNPADCLTVSVKDRFGSYGLTGVMIVANEGDALVVDTFLLSCRALGRGVEQRMLTRLGELSKERGLARLEIPFVESKRNKPAALFLQSMGLLPMTADQTVAARLLPEGKPSPKPAMRKIDYARIATELRRPAAILDAIRASTKTKAPKTAKFDPPRTPLESALSELWVELLNLTAVGIHDNFFELGGHSLLAVQLLSRVRQIYGVDLSLEVVYSGEFTVAELAKAVELKEIEQGGGDYQDLMRELEGLSDDEVRALLAEEQDAS